MAATAYAHIDFTDTGSPIIAGTSMKVEQLVLDHLAYGWDAAQLYLQYPYLSLGEIYGALAYYYDHKGEMDQAIADGLRRVDEIRASMDVSWLREKLQSRGRLS
ncbi:MAG: DUF433 domain-containing protein [Anaerolineae bacterium]